MTLTTESLPPLSSILADDPLRHLTVARPDHDATLSHLGLVGDTFTILVSGEESGGQYALIDMHIPPGGGPPPHRHDFEEMFSVLEGEVEVTFRGEHLVARAGETINVPANEPHAFRNAADEAARLLCVCSPPGLFQRSQCAGGVADRAAAALDQAARAAFIAKSKALAPGFRTELLWP